MNDHRFILEPYLGAKTKYKCPECESLKSFSRYIDTETIEYLSEYVGRCNREVNCAYHYTPKQYFEDNPSASGNEFPTHLAKRDASQVLQGLPPKSTTYIDTDLANQSLRNYEQNNFALYLCSLFGVELTNSLIDKYFLGTSKQMNGACVFWQVDDSCRVRSGKIMLYNEHTGRRKKYTNWAHSVLLRTGKISEFNLSICLFGLHLLITEPKEKPIAVCESEKTAMIASVYLPQFIWMAAGALSWLSAERLKPLAGRKVVLFPDLNAFEKWQEKAREIVTYVPGINITISDFLDQRASEQDKAAGLDLADYLIRYDYREINLPEGWEYKSFIRFDGVLCKNLINEHGYPAMWD